jgi:Yip1 domain
METAPATPTIPSTEPQKSSFFDRIVNVFASPGELYMEVSQTPVKASSWVIPYLLAIIVAIISTYAILSNQVLRQQAMEPQHQVIQERLDRGQMTQEQADAALEMMDSSPIIIISGVVMSIVYVSVSLFIGALLFWLAGKLLMKSPAGYKKMLEMYGLAMLIGIVGSIITLLMMHAMGSIFASPGGSLLIMNSFDRKNLFHDLIAALNIFSIWQMVVAGIGLAKCAGKPTGTGIAISLSMWIIFWILVPTIFGRMMS